MPGEYFIFVSLLKVLDQYREVIWQFWLQRTHFPHLRPPVDHNVLKMFGVPPEVVMHLGGFGLAKSLLCPVLLIKAGRCVSQCILKLIGLVNAVGAS